MRRLARSGLVAGMVTLAALPSAAAAESGAIGLVDGPEAASVSDDVWLRGDAYAHLMDAMLAARQGEFRRASAEVRRAIELQPDSSDVLVESARMFERLGRTDEAEEIGRRVLELDPDDADGIRFLADLLTSRVHVPSRADAERRQEALALYERLRAVDDGDAEVLRRVISLHLQAGDRGEALALSRRLVELRPGDARASGLLAQLLLHDERPREALTVLLDYLVAHPDDPTLLGDAEELARELDAWDVVADRLAAVDPQDGTRVGGTRVSALRLRGQALFRLRRFDEATRALEQVLAADPEDQQIRNTLAQSYRSQGRYGDAVELAGELVDRFPDDRGARLLLAEILDDQGRPSEALDQFSVALELFEGQEGNEPLEVRDAIRRRMVELMLRSGRLREAPAVIAGFEEPDAADALRVRARVAIELEHWPRALDLAQALRRSGDTGAAALIEGEVHLRSGALDRAAVRFDEATSALGPFTRVRAAESYLEAGETERGRRLLQAWVDAEPDNADARYYLGNFLFRSGDEEQGEEELRRAIRLAPDHAPALNFLGYSLAERGEHLDEALQLIRRALEHDPWNGAYLDSLGWVYYRLGRDAEARDPLERAERTYPRDTTVLAHLGDLYIRLGERERALAVWRRALAAQPDDVEDLQARIRLHELPADDPTDRIDTPEPR